MNVHQRILIGTQTVLPVVKKLFIKKIKIFPKLIFYSKLHIAMKLKLVMESNFVNQMSVSIVNQTFANVQEHIRIGALLYLAVN